MESSTQFAEATIRGILDERGPGGQCALLATAESRAIVGKHIAITAVDSGCFSPSDDDRTAGWIDTGGIAYSPRLESVAMLPRGCCCRDCCGFDEWYIFGTEPPTLGSICHANVFETAIAPPNVFQFINFGGFQLSDPQMKAITDLFWT